MVLHYFSRKGNTFLLTAALMFCCSSCISFRSELEGKYGSDSKKRSPSTPVSVFFYFSHLEEEKGFDVVPKIIPPRRGFRDIFSESMKQITNIKSFATFTDDDNDIDDVKRRTFRDSLKGANDFTVHITFQLQNSFAKHVLGMIVTYGTLGLVPIAYSWEYIVTAEVSNASGKVFKTYTRTSSLTTWYHDIFLFFYPFLPSQVKIEEIYLESMQDIFKQIEDDAVLSI